MAYVLNDNRASGGGLFEDDAYACPHCQGVIFKSVWKKRGGYCFHCDKPVCYSCFQAMQQYGCMPYLRQIEMALQGKPALTYEDIVRQTAFVMPRPAIPFFPEKIRDSDERK